ncbi:MAG: glucokinase [Hyphomicrobiaceae bacterium]
MTTAAAHPLLVADAGGTNARFAVQHEAGGPIVHVARLRTAEFASFEAAAAQAIAPLRPRPVRAMVCGAGPLVGGRIKLTNAAWQLDPATIAAHLGLSDCGLLNDLQALALGIPHLRGDHLQPIGPPIAADGGPRLVIGIGTGLGVAALVETACGINAVASEAGQIDLHPITADEMALWPHLAPPGARVPLESVISGPGLARLAAALDRAREADRASAGTTAAQRLVLVGDRPIAITALQIFVRLLGRIAGDLALVFKATGGVHLAGGVAIALGSHLESCGFRQAFEANPALDRLTTRIPTLRVTTDDAALIGLAAHGAGRRTG